MSHLSALQMHANRFVAYLWQLIGRCVPNYLNSYSLEQWPLDEFRKKKSSRKILIDLVYKELNIQDETNVAFCCQFQG